MQLLEVLLNFVFWDWATDIRLALGRENHKSRSIPISMKKPYSRIIKLAKKKKENKPLPSAVDKDHVV